MIVKMKFINISGPRDDIDRVTDLYLSKYEIQLESALSELKTVNNLRPFVEINPYRDALAQAPPFWRTRIKSGPMKSWGWTACLKSSAIPAPTIKACRTKKRT